MRGKFPDDGLQQLADPDKGMFPPPREIRLSCDCPDGALLCKHLAAVLYGVGHRLDREPELLFRLRGVNQQDMIAEALSSQSVDTALGLDQESAIDRSDLASIFGIDLAVGDVESMLPRVLPQTGSALLTIGASIRCPSTCGCWRGRQGMLSGGRIRT